HPVQHRPGMDLVNDQAALSQLISHLSPLCPGHVWLGRLPLPYIGTRFNRTRVLMIIHRPAAIKDGSAVNPGQFPPDATIATSATIARACVFYSPVGQTEG